MNLFQFGDFTLNSGAKSSWKLECDALTDADWLALAEMVSQLVPSFRTVEGVPRGGLKLANALKPYCRDFGRSGCHLIVDDVLTTGGSMNRLRGTHEMSEQVYGAVVFARGPLPTWIQAVFQMPEVFWIRRWS